MSGFVEGIDRSQSSLFPAELEDYVAEDAPHPGRSLAGRHLWRPHRGRPAIGGGIDRLLQRLRKIHGDGGRPDLAQDDEPRW